MTFHQPTGATAPLHGTSHTGLASPIVVLAVLALILDAAILVAGKMGVNPVIPIEIIGGLAYRVNPLIPLAEALILGYGLWRYAGLGIGRTVLAVIFLFAIRIAAAAVGNYLTGILIANLPDAVVTEPSAFLLPIVLQTIFTSACILLVLAISAAAFRSVVVWLVVIILWSGGAAAVYALFRNGTISATASLYLTPIVRAVGFLAIGWAFTRRRSA
jgi:hypothetical protein